MEAIRCNRINSSALAISIHAPTGSVTTSKMTQDLADSHFYTRSQWERYERTSFRVIKSFISILAPVGSDTQ